MDATSDFVWTFVFRCFRAEESGLRITAASLVRLSPAGFGVKGLGFRV